jgi:Flp pilus assembly protein TadB
LDYLRRRGLTPLEVRIFFSGLIVTIALVVLVAIGVVGSWVLLVACAIAATVSLMRYRAEIEQKKRNADDRRE